jgi:hypothetical protein
MVSPGTLHDFNKQDILTVDADSDNEGMVSDESLSDVGDFEDEV